MRHSPYDDPALYDLIAPPDADMAAFYVGEAGSAGRDVLELACGTGRFTLPLARSGAHVAGGDLSPTMLAEARRRAEAENLQVRFVELDMRDFALNGDFDAVVVAANSMMHLHTSEDFAGLFSSVRRHLRPGGRLLFDVFVPNAAILSRAPDERHHLGRFEDGARGTITVEEAIRYDPATQISHVTWHWSSEAERDFRRHELALRQIFPQELLSLLSTNGFRLVARYGDFERAAFSGSSWRQVCVCE